MLAKPTKANDSGGITPYTKPTSMYGIRRKFTHFMSLPLEIRLMIWEAALPPPRLVRIRQRRSQQTFGDWKKRHGEEWPGTLDYHNSKNNSGREVTKLTDDEDCDTVDPELEDVIWRGIEARSAINLALGGDGNLKRFHRAHPVKILSTCPPPDIYRVCRESHRLLSCTYTRAFACVGSIPKTFFNFDLDTLYIRSRDFSCYAGWPRPRPLAELAGHLGISDTQNLARVKKLAVYLEDMFTSDQLDRSLVDILRIFLGVEDIFLVVTEFSGGKEMAEDACLVDPIYVTSAIEAYHRYHHIISSGLKLEVRLLTVPAVDRVNSCIRNLKTHWGKAIPRIHANSLVSASLKRELDRAKRMYQSALRNYEIEMERVKEERMRANLLASGCCMQDVLMDEDIDIDIDEEVRCSDDAAPSDQAFDDGWSSQDFEGLNWTAEDRQMSHGDGSDEEFDTGWTAEELMSDDELSQLYE